jgi:hypothetical protein
MKYLLSILLIILLAGCHFSAGTAAKKIGSEVKKCCTSLCIAPVAIDQQQTVLTDNSETSVSPVILFEQPGHILTW